MCVSIRRYRRNKRRRLPREGKVLPDKQVKILGNKEKK